MLFLGAGSLLSFGYYLQFYKGIEPCPLCMFQRFAYMAVILFSLVALIHGPKNWWLRVYSSLILSAALVGGAIAAYQVRLIYLPPDQVPECGPGWNYMVDVFPLADVSQTQYSGVEFDLLFRYRRAQCGPSDPEKIVRRYLNKDSPDAA
ncbi:MAG: disulfide bond formation protein DsbB [Gammaproteobacteria bacterium]|nr:disulfide bond formation protein DsbB [Gammaproteobacteria bacterium]